MLNAQILYSKYSQSVWLDYIDRNLVDRGGLRILMDEGVRGVTSNPTIFHKAITGSTDYDDDILDLAEAGEGVDEETLFQWLAIKDVRMAADILKAVYISSEERDGFVSQEVSPHLASDAEATIEAARHLWKIVDRPNLMIKVPATKAGLSAIEHLTAEGINVNATLLFSVERYKEVIEAHRRGLSKNENPVKIASVASFFLSRIDTKVDDALDKLGTPEAQQLKGRIAIASARMAYKYFKAFINYPAFSAERNRGAHVQRPLWASTGTKNPAYSDVMYVEPLIGADTVNTLPPKTLDALQAHAELYATLETGMDEARENLEALAALGINLNQITQELEEEGVKKFADSYDQLMAGLKQKCFELTKQYAG
ncbi:MAG: transaldolase [Gammaproteobacteria bacterium]|jgi:transaldolase|nr:transaldolase [Gammaproteobacteria bacterium]